MYTKVCTGNCGSPIGNLCTEYILFINAGAVKIFVHLQGDKNLLLISMPYGKLTPGKNFLFIFRLDNFNKLFMRPARMEAFSNGAMAIIITIMVLEIKVPHGENLASLPPLTPVFSSYILSFSNVEIYWNNHHHMLHIIHSLNGKVLWAFVPDKRIEKD